MIRVLMVDDEPLVRRGIVAGVDWAALGCEVVGEAQSGEEGLALARKLKPELIITDIRMPKMDGITVLKNIRAQGKLDVLFERFYRLDSSRNSGTGGSGIGLSVAQAIVQAHKGKITAENKTGNGLTITVLL